jgi:hypothetical protein
VYVLAVVVLFIVVFLYCVCALFVCNVCYLSVVLLYYCHRVKAQLHSNEYIHTYNPKRHGAKQARNFLSYWSACLTFITNSFIKNGVIWDVTLCGSCKNRLFGGRERSGGSRYSPLHPQSEFHTSFLSLFVFLRSVPRLLVTANVPSSPIHVTLMMDGLRSYETSVLTRCALSNIPKDAILHSHRHENLKSYIIIHNFAINTCVLNAIQVELTRMFMDYIQGPVSLSRPRRFGDWLSSSSGGETEPVSETS